MRTPFTLRAEDYRDRPDGKRDSNERMFAVIEMIVAVRDAREPAQAGTARMTGSMN